MAAGMQVPEIQSPLFLAHTSQALLPNKNKTLLDYSCMSLLIYSRNGFYFHHLPLCYTRNPIHGFNAEPFFVLARLSENIFPAPYAQ